MRTVSTLSKITEKYAITVREKLFSFSLALAFTLSLFALACVISSSWLCFITFILFCVWEQLQKVSQCRIHCHLIWGFCLHMLIFDNEEIKSAHFFFHSYSLCPLHLFVVLDAVVVVVLMSTINKQLTIRCNQIAIVLIIICFFKILFSICGKI